MAGRSMTAAALTEAAASVKRVVELAEFQFSSGTIRLTNHVKDVVFNGNTYTAVGGLGSISEIHESAEPSATGVNFSLSGVSPSRVAIALDEHYIGRTCKAFLAFLDASHNIVLDPVLIYEGLMDTMPVELGDQQAVISITAESVLRRWETPNVRRLTNEDQQKLYAGDRGLEFVAEMVDKELVWGKS